jgi:hypothetical protein
MKDDTPPGITTNTGNPEDLNPDGDTPWSSNPDETTEPKLTVTLPEEEPVTEVKLVNPKNVEDYTVVVTDEEGNTETV